MAQPEYDVEWMRSIAGGDEAALHELYAAYGQRLYAYALRLTNDPAAAEDVVQETLIVVWRTASRFRGDGRVLAWLLGIVHNLAIKAIRHQHLPFSDEMEADLYAAGDLPEDQAQSSEQAHWVQHALQHLSTEHRAVLELVFYQGLTLAEVAQVCNCPPGTVKSRLSYARQYLRSVLKRENMEDWR